MQVDIASDFRPLPGLPMDNAIDRIYSMPSLSKLNTCQTQGHSTMRELDQLLNARNFLIKQRTSYDAAYAEFSWPKLDTAQPLSPVLRQ
jgi:hypothetical protein